jgi:hypothetical protein
VLGTLNACAAPPKMIAFQGDTIGKGGNPIKAAMIVTIDIAFTPGTTNVGTTYPVEYAPTAPFIHFQSAEVGTVLSYDLAVFPVEPGQIVTCLVSINGLVARSSRSRYPSPAVCPGGPV